MLCSGIKLQEGYLTKKSGAWIGHYSKCVLDAKTGAKRRQQKAFRIGATSMTLSKAKLALRERIVEETGLTADNRTTLASLWALAIDRLRFA